MRRKEEQTHFIRDPRTGRIIRVERKGNMQLSPERLQAIERRKQEQREKEHIMKLEYEYKQRQAVEKAKQQAARRKKMQKVSKAIGSAVQTSKNTSKATMIKSSDLKLNLNTPSKKSSGLNSHKKYVIQNGVAYPIATSKKRSKKKKEGDFNWDDFGMPSWKDLMK